MLEDDRIKQAIRTWLEARGTGLVPTASQFGPFQLRPLLPNVAIFRRVREGEHIVSLQGTALVETFGFDATGQNMSVIYEEEKAASMNKLYDFLYSGPYLSHSHRIHTRSSGKRFTIEQLLLPVTSDEGVHDRYVWIGCNMQKPRLPHLNPGKPPPLGDLKERTVYDLRTLLPVECYATTERDEAAMAVPLTIHLS